MGAIRAPARDRPPRRPMIFQRAGDMTQPGMQTLAPPSISLEFSVEIPQNSGIFVRESTIFVDFPKLSYGGKISCLVILSFLLSR